MGSSGQGILGPFNPELDVKEGLWALGGLLASRGAHSWRKYRVGHSRLSSLKVRGPGFPGLRAVLIMGSKDREDLIVSKDVL